MTEEQAKSRFAAEIRGFELLAEYFSRWEPGFKVLYMDGEFSGYDAAQGKTREGHYFPYGDMKTNRFVGMLQQLWEWFGIKTLKKNLVVLKVTDEKLECFVFLKRPECTKDEWVDDWVAAHYYNKVLCAGDDWEVDSAHYVYISETGRKTYEWKLMRGGYPGKSNYSLELLERSYKNLKGWPAKVMREYEAVREKLRCLN